MHYARCSRTFEHARTRIESCDFIVLIGDPRFFFILFCLALRVEWERWALSISFVRHVTCDVKLSVWTALAPFLSLFFYIIVCTLFEDVRVKQYIGEVRSEI